MTDNTNENTTETTGETIAQTPAPAGRSMGRKILIGAGTLLAIGAIGVAAAVGSGFKHGHWGMHGKMRDFAEWRMERVLDKVDATDEQKTKLKAIFETTFEEVGPKGQHFGEMRDKVATIMKAPTIDRAAIEALRVERVAEMEKKSQVIAKAIGDAAEVLTPEQRLKLVEQFGRMHDGDND